ncbi:unnamed protein product [Cuscuta campestris]|uniref:Uncharacterized protein n=1 Tax=Cuscuta campestris TaxID=132261 RepID=A0A484M994_9ASTE|nr:unnamed protein product [Cuscuta campestris]
MNFSRPALARCCVEVDISNLPPARILINHGGEELIFPFLYEDVPLFARGAGGLGMIWKHVSIGGKRRSPLTGKQWRCRRRGKTMQWIRILESGKRLNPKRVKPRYLWNQHIRKSGRPDLPILHMMCGRKVHEKLPKPRQVQLTPAQAVFSPMRLKK